MRRRRGIISASMSNRPFAVFGRGAAKHRSARKRAVLLLSLILSLAWTGAGAAPAPPVPDLVIEAGGRALGKATKNSVGMPRVDWVFASAANHADATIRLAHRDVLRPFFVECNGRRLGQLSISYRVERENYFSVPAGVLKDGRNTLSIVGEDYGRAITVSNVVLFRQPLRDLLNLRTIFVSVSDRASGQPVPSRLTIVDRQGRGAPIFSVSATNTGVRTGIIYSLGREFSFEVPDGRYDLYATRGMEWSLGHRAVTTSSQPVTARLVIGRQVDTKGFIAADTHIHNLTFSGHGDAVIEERMLSLAGEGVELGVATDHNHFTDYRPYQREMGVSEYFTPVVGNEITTKNGHLNGFPFPLGGEVPDFHETDWVKLVSDIRLKGAKVVILNHPRWPDAEKNPLMRFAFNRATGECDNGPAFTFDAMELVNSSASVQIAREEVKANATRLLADWFAVLNHGNKVTGAGASDSHTLHNPVGQGRTYIRSSTDDAARLDVDELCANYLAGDTSVSYGIFADVIVDGRRHMGGQLQPRQGKLDVRLRIQSADWITPRRAIVFLNGLPVATRELEPKPGKAFDRTLRISLPAPAWDAYLVCAVFGDPVTAPYWPTLAHFTAAVTNPLYVDGDGDGRYQSPRETARGMLARTDGGLESAWRLVEDADDALAGQMLGLLAGGKDAAFLRQLESRARAAAGTRELYASFLETRRAP